MSLQSPANKKTYSPPKLNKLTKEQATLVLLGHLTHGDQGAKDLLDVLYPACEREDHGDFSSHSEEEDSIQSGSGRNRVVSRAMAFLRSTREDFRRLVRG